MNYCNDADANSLMQGFCQSEDGHYHCLFCRQQYLKGDIYTFDKRLVNAETAIKLHIQEAHVSPFDVLIAEDKKITGLTDTQREIMALFYSGISDKEIARKMNLSPATVRYQRYHFREKARQANVYLALYQLMDAKIEGEPQPMIHNGATMIDERYMITPDEEEKILGSVFISLSPPVLRVFPPKEKKKLVILRKIVQEFEPDKKYSEQEINGILKAIFDDYVTLRRYLIEYGFLDRTRNGREYWLK